MSTATAAQLNTLKAAINDKPPYTTGIFTLPAGNGTLFYGKGNNIRRVDLTAASDEELEHLSRACDPATFGVNQTDILDESYRKAGKLDTADFSSKFCAEKCGLIKAVAPELLEGHDEQTPMIAELYKLNVYGKGSFFKAHKDTPRDDSMFGSLVVIFPTLHEGGELVFRHGGKEWKIDSAKQLSAQISPCVFFIAFYSDVEHEVMPVISGHRVTITYNLYFAPTGPTTKVDKALRPIFEPHDQAFKATLAQMLDDPTFMPKGGNLGFGLSHQYPVNLASNTLRGLVDCLKGTDAVIRRTCQELSLEASPRVIYETSRALVMVDKIADLEGGEVSCSTATLHLEFGGKFIEIFEDEEPPSAEPKHPWSTEYRLYVHEHVSWVRKLTTFNQAVSKYVAYGNEAHMEAVYGDICLIVRVGPVGERKTVKV